MEVRGRKFIKRLSDFASLRKDGNNMRFQYPAELWNAGPNEVVVSFRDIPGCHTSGKDEAEALEEA